MRSTPADAPELGFLDETFLTLGAGYRNFPLFSGHPHLLSATGTAIIPMLPILQLHKEMKKSPIFLIPLIGIAGHHPENAVKHQDHINGHHDCTGGCVFNKQRHNIDDQRRYKHSHIQLVTAVAPHHKSAHTHAYSLKKAHKFTFQIIIQGYYSLIFVVFNCFESLFTEY